MMLDMMEPEDDGGFSSCAAAGWGFEDVDPALSDDAGLVGRLCPAVWALILGRRGEDMGFMALSRVETSELMLDKNPPSDELPLSFFFKRASAFACCFSAAAASLATCDANEGKCVLTQVQALLRGQRVVDKRFIWSGALHLLRHAGPCRSRAHDECKNE